MTSTPDSIPADVLEPVLSAGAMRDVDAYTIRDFGIPAFTLMELAGRAAVAAAIRRFGPFHRRRVVILCGKGNNGGDGLVMARGFLAAGADVSVIMLSDPDALAEDVLKNYRALAMLGNSVAPERLSIVTFSTESGTNSFPQADLYVDALLGTGLTEALRDPIRSLVSWLNEQASPVLSVDVPTGLHSDTGLVLGAAVHADMTVTMGALKTGMLVNEGPDCAGEVVVAEIGIPRYALLERCDMTSCAVRTTDDLVRELLPRRARSAHKYSVGMTLLIAGSPGLTGAPVMASSAAARIGSGAVVCACHGDVQSVLASKLTEVMTLGLPGRGAGELDPDAALEVLAPRLEQASALLLGCGLGKGAGTQDLVRRLCTTTRLPLVLDADGLTAFAHHTDILARHAAGRWILTPHAGEFRRLAGDVPLDDRVEIVRSWAAQWACVLVLKGMPTLIGTPGGRVFICGTGNPALATAGTGDVLAGLTAGLLSQGLSAVQAAVCAVHIGGACADAYTAERSGRTMQATDLLQQLPRVLRSRFEQSG